MRFTRFLVLTACLATPALAQGDSQDNPAPNQVKPGPGQVAHAEPDSFHPVDAFPTNEIPSRPHVAPQGSETGLKRPSQHFDAP